MPTPVIHNFPVQRPNFVLTANWAGPDDDLALEITFPDMGGITRSLSFQTRNIGAGNAGEICLPVSLLGNDLNNLGPRARDVLISHTRMACMISGIAVPGSKEFEESFIQSTSTNNLQTALGTVKVTTAVPIDDQRVDLTYKCGTGPNYVVTTDHGEINNYVFAPQTQLLIIPGAIRKQFSYIHNYPTNILTTQQRADIVSYVLSLAPWV